MSGIHRVSSLRTLPTHEPNRISRVCNAPNNASKEYTFDALDAALQNIPRIQHLFKCKAKGQLRYQGKIN